MNKNITVKVARDTLDFYMREEKSAIQANMEWVPSKRTIEAINEALEVVKTSKQPLPKRLEKWYESELNS